MKKLFIIDGAMRPAKNELVRHLVKLEKNLPGGQMSTVCLAKKFCTEDGGDDQDYEMKQDLVELINQDKEKWISYVYAERTYALLKEYLDNQINDHEYTFLIARNTELVFELKEKYEHHSIPIQVVTVYIYSDKKAIEIAYKGTSRETTLKERNERLKSADSDYENAMALKKKYDETLIYTKENGDGSASLAVKINSLIDKYKNLIEPHSVFLIHSFSDYKNNAQKMYESLKGAVEECFSSDMKKSCVGLINEKGSYKIGETTWEMIDKSDIIICDITPDRYGDRERANPTQIKRRYHVSKDNKSLHTSPNVWIELGYTLCVMKIRNIKIGKRLLLTCRLSDDGELPQLPADVNDLNIVGYKDYEDFNKQIINHLEKMTK